MQRHRQKRGLVETWSTRDGCSKPDAPQATAEIDKERVAYGKNVARLVRRRAHGGRACRGQDYRVYRLMAICIRQCRVVWFLDCVSRRAVSLRISHHDRVARSDYALDLHYHVAESGGASRQASCRGRLRDRRRGKEG